MATSTTEHSVFVASPGDTGADRGHVRTVVDEINSNFAPEGQRLRVLRWETDVRPDGGRPQAVINEQLADYDIFVAMLWTRLGTPTGGFGSGTEEEIMGALTRRASDPALSIFVYFCKRPFWPASLEDVDQLRRLFEFRDRMEREQRLLPWYYISEVEFRDNLRSHLCRHLREAAKPASRPARGAQPDAVSIQDLRAIWPHLDKGAQAAFSIAYNENRAAGDPGVATEHLFSALQRVAADSNDPLRDLLAEIPSQALPQPVEGAVIESPYIAEEQPWLSHCVANSIKRLLQHQPERRKITGADIFADIAKHGTGGSVRRLRKNGIQPEHIDSAIAKVGLDIIRTGQASV